MTPHEAAAKAFGLLAALCREEYQAALVAPGERDEGYEEDASLAAEAADRMRLWHEAGEEGIGPADEWRGDVETHASVLSGEIDDAQEIALHLSRLARA